MQHECFYNLASCHCKTRPSGRKANAPSTNFVGPCQNRLEISRLSLKFNLTFSCNAVPDDDGYGSPSDLRRLPVSLLSNESLAFMMSSVQTTSVLHVRSAWASQTWEYGPLSAIKCKCIAQHIFRDYESSLYMLTPRKECP